MPQAPLTLRRLFFFFFSLPRLIIILDFKKKKKQRGEVEREGKFHFGYVRALNPSRPPSTHFPARGAAAAPPIDVSALWEARAGN